ncbi:hypothetical protein UFOVP802_9 [uncultured Caudovirales phage]|uniref:Uncharacterized protein n=1 Tax=uncultured Caudovirales phage TaxID=2100421 RepID=A0A6J5P1H4_9CAUD|nr:hypothetical protein UFOVP802_9 [uncultured Caudovirales phage]
MTATSIQVDVRDVLAAALAGVAASVYPAVPEALIPPACIIVPDSPWMESTLIGNSLVKVKLNFVITAAVAYNNNAGALDGLEKLIISILGAMPSGYVVGDVSIPSVTSVGSSNLLVADLSVSTYYNQENI